MPLPPEQRCTSNSRLPWNCIAPAYIFGGQDVQYLDQNLSCIRLRELKVLLRVEPPRRPRNAGGFREYAATSLASRITTLYNTSQKHRTALEAHSTQSLVANEIKAVEATEGTHGHITHPQRHLQERLPYGPGNVDGLIPLAVFLHFLKNGESNNSNRTPCTRCMD